MSGIDMHTDTIHHHVLPLDSPHATLERVGGKGVNLARLARGGFAVPTGFLIATHAYGDFTRRNGLATWIDAQVRATQTDDPDALVAVSEQIRARFRALEMPPALAQDILEAYARLGQPAVAVRSSATAEDLPEMSFAGQQDTYLNVMGEDALLEAVRDCWGSLWTARAIGYRSRNGIDHAQVALAVIVQEMVQSEASGVLFTANPLTGRRTETVIDATVGLGEALVGGLVEPDQYVVETATGRILSRHVGAKATVIRGATGGGVVTEQVEAASTSLPWHVGHSMPALDDDAIGELVRLGKAVAAEYDAPQDIEWAYVGGQFHVLQARPITALYPLPVRRDLSSGPHATAKGEINPDELRVYLSFGGIQGVLAPFTPLGQDTIQALFAGGARLFGYRAVTAETQGALHVAGDRLWVDMTHFVRNGVGRKLLARILIIADSGSTEAFQTLLDDARLQPTSPRPSGATVRRIAPVLLGIAARFLRSMARPDRAREELQARIEATLAQAKREAEGVDTLADWLRLHARITHAVFFFLIPHFVPRVLGGYVAVTLLHRLATALALELTRGLPHNVTTEMDLALWQAAHAVKTGAAGQPDADAANIFQNGDIAHLAARYEAGTLPPAAQTALNDFLACYGMRGAGEIDFGRPRWREDPAPLLRTLQSYLAIDDPRMAPDAVFRRGEDAAAQAAAQLAQAASARWGRVGAWGVRWLVRRVRALAGLRESPKFTMIRLLGISRTALLRVGAKLAEEGVLDRADDLGFLHLRELQVLSMGAPGDWRQLVAQRRAALEREARRKPIPRVLLSDGAAIYDGMGAATATDGVITGSPVSAGVVEGNVRVVFDPNHADLQPGEILVCPGTDPAWTPLFLLAGGLVMEVGGLMTHGSVVAREYGIPAVVGVDRATERLQTGQRVRIDGSTGQIAVISRNDQE